MTQRRGTLVAFVTYVLWGLLTIYWKQLHGLQALELIGARITLSALLLAVALTAMRQWAPVRAAFRNPRLLARLGVASLLISANWITYVWAVGHDRIVETALGYFISPLLTMVFGVVLFHEPVSTLRRIALGLGAAAMVVLVAAYGRVPIVAVVLALSWSCYSAMKREVPLGPVQSLGGETFIVAIPALAYLAFRAGGDGLLVGATSRQLVLVCFVGVVTAVPLLLFAAAARSVPFTVLGPISYLIPTINFLLGVVAYHEAFDGARLIGFALVWVGLALVAFDGIRSAHAARSARSAPLTPSPATVTATSK